ncbi:MAG: polyamine aminopropyltransferase [Alphaproteobacteria bacterium]|nr:polyamine aminopropyltransferase [Alphaproteobacteria bacterium]
MERWIAETFYADWRPSMRVDNILHEVETEHQHLVIFENKTWGTVLILDGIFQLTTRDEFIYHEMMAHVPLMAMERPKNVLIIGGGDGGILREVLKHPSLRQATLVEIDQAVIDTSVKYFPKVGAKAFKDPRANIVIADGLKFVAECEQRFDAVIVDSSEPVGPSAVLHTRKFFADCQKLLTEDGVFITQNGVPFQHPQHLAKTTQALAGLYQNVSPYICTQPCYFGGEFALNWASDSNAHLQVDEATLARRARSRKIETRYWTPALHKGAFALPKFMQDVVDKAAAKARTIKPARKTKPARKAS